MLNPHKFIPPIDTHMKSFNESDMTVEYKSSLELKAIRYCDFNKHVVKFGVEPFNIKYIKPTDGKSHRYYIDLFMEFVSGDKFLVEIKSSGETKPPKKPRKKTEKAKRNYQNACMIYAINQAKWAAATEMANKNNMKFIILTEKELG